jgi:transcriptional regulator with XRE-family HTH domain
MKLQYPITRGAVILKEKIRILGKTYEQVKVDLGIKASNPANGGGISSWIHGRWRPNAEMRAKMTAIYGIPVDAWEKIVVEGQKDLKAVLREQRKQKTMREKSKNATTIEPASAVNRVKKYSRTVGALALEVIGLERVYQSMVSETEPPSLRQSIAGWISGKWMPSITRRHQLEKLHGVPPSLWLRTVGPGADSKPTKATNGAARTPTSAVASRPMPARPTAASEETPLSIIASSLRSGIISREQATAMLKKLREQ